LLIIPSVLTVISLHEVIGIKVRGNGLVIVVASVSVSWSHGTAVPPDVLISWWRRTLVWRRRTCRRSVHSVTVVWRHCRWIWSIGVVRPRLAMGIIAGTWAWSIGGRCGAVVGTRQVLRAIICGAWWTRRILRAIIRGSWWTGRIFRTVCSGTRWPGRITRSVLRRTTRWPHRWRGVSLRGPVAVTVSVAQSKDGSRRAVGRGPEAFILRRLYGSIVRSIALIHLGGIGRIAPGNVGLLVGRGVVVLVERGVLVEGIQIVREVQAVAHTRRRGQGGSQRRWWTPRSVGRWVHHQHGRVAHIQRPVRQIQWRRSRRYGTGTWHRQWTGGNRVVAQVEAVSFARVQIKVGIENHAPRTPAAPGAVLLR